MFRHKPEHTCARGGVPAHPGVHGTPAIQIQAESLAVPRPARDSVHVRCQAARAPPVRRTPAELSWSHARMRPARHTAVPAKDGLQQHSFGTSRLPRPVGGTDDGREARERRRDLSMPAHSPWTRTESVGASIAALLNPCHVPLPVPGSARWGPGACAAERERELCHGSAWSSACVALVCVEERR